MRDAENENFMPLPPNRFELVALSCIIIMTLVIASGGF
jgi:hypothetical protein